MDIFLLVKAILVIWLIFPDDAPKISPLRNADLWYAQEQARPDFGVNWQLLAQSDTTLKVVLAK